MSEVSLDTVFQPKFCRDCKNKDSFFYEELGLVPDNRHLTWIDVCLAEVQISLITGRPKPTEKHTCQLVRFDNSKCGMGGRWFEPREIKHQTQQQSTGKSDILDRI